MPNTESVVTATERAVELRSLQKQAAQQISEAHCILTLLECADYDCGDADSAVVIDAAVIRDALCRVRRLLDAAMHLQYEAHQLMRTQPPSALQDVLAEAAQTLRQSVDC